MQRWIRLIAIAAAMLAAAPMAAAADEWPTKPIRMVVPYAAGGNTDVLARLIAQRLSASLGQQVIVDNRPGGNTLPATELVAKAPPDGYTILLTTLTFVVVPSLYPTLPFDPIKSFTPITLAVTLPNVLVINPELPVQSMKDFIAYAKANPGKMSYASTGSGTSPHLSMELLKSMASIDLVHIPYKGGAPALTDLIGNRTQAQFIGLPVAIPHIASGKLRAIGVTSKERASAAPSIPTIAETVPGYELDPWFGVLGPAGMSKVIVDRLQQEISRILRTQEVREQLASLGAEPVASTPAIFATHLQAEIERYRKLVKDAGVKVE